MKTFMSSLNHAPNQPQDMKLHAIDHLGDAGALSRG
jgi:hypothetical protein